MFSSPPIYGLLGIPILAYYEKLHGFKQKSMNGFNDKETKTNATAKWKQITVFIFYPCTLQKEEIRDDTFALK